MIESRRRDNHCSRQLARHRSQRAGMLAHPQNDARKTGTAHDWFDSNKITPTPVGVIQLRSGTTHGMMVDIDNDQRTLTSSEGKKEVPSFAARCWIWNLLSSHNQQARIGDVSVETRSRPFFHKVVWLGRRSFKFDGNSP
jgi:hypothetical protein